MGTNTSSGVGCENINNTNCSWYYTWGTTIPTAQEVNMLESSEFVPMFWGAGNVNTTNIDKLNLLRVKVK